MINNPDFVNRVRRIDHYFYLFPLKYRTNTLKRFEPNNQLKSAKYGVSARYH